MPDWVNCCALSAYRVWRNPLAKHAFAQLVKGDARAAHCARCPSLGQHEDGKDEEVQSMQHCGQLLIFLGQAPEACCPRKAALPPNAWAAHEVFLRLVNLDNLQLDALALAS